MKSNYKRLGDYIKPVNIRNKDLQVTKLLGVSIQKILMPSIANTVGTNMKTYKIIKKNQFAYGPVTSRNGDKISIALLQDFDEAIISQAYTVFEIKDVEILNPEYLMMWFRRPEFDRYARYKSHGSARETFDWDEMCEVELPIPSIEKQNEIVKEYNTVVNRIKLNEQLNQKLEETAQAIYKHWFVENEKDVTSDYLSLDKYVDVNPRLTVKKGKDSVFVEMASVQVNSLSVISTIVKPYKSGTKFMNNDTLMARITPSLENGKSGFVDFLKPNEIAFGSTEFLVLRAKENVSPFWNYCLTKDESFRVYAISGMTGTSGRQRVDAEHIKEYKVKEIDSDRMQQFDIMVAQIFKKVKIDSIQNRGLKEVEELLLSKMSKL